MLLVFFFNNGGITVPQHGEGQIKPIEMREIFEDPFLLAGSYTRTVPSIHRLNQCSETLVNGF